MNSATARKVDRSLNPQTVLEIQVTVFLKGSCIGRKSFFSDRVLIGRDFEANLQLDHPAISRSHAYLALTANGIEVQDLKSHNGTFVNDRRVDRSSLRCRDRVSIGPFTLKASVHERDLSAVRDPTEPHLLEPALEMERIATIRVCAPAGAPPPAQPKPVMETKQPRLHVRSVVRALFPEGFTGPAEPPPGLAVVFADSPAGVALELPPEPSLSFRTLLDLWHKPGAKTWRSCMGLATIVNALMVLLVASIGTKDETAPRQPANAIEPAAEISDGSFLWQLMLNPPESTPAPAQPRVDLTLDLSNPQQPEPPKAPAHGKIAARPAIAKAAVVKDSKPPAVEFGKGRLDRKAIAAVVRKHMAEVQSCYEMGLLHSSRLRGKVVLEWVIDAAGAVKDVRIQKNTLSSPTVASCVAAELAGWKFPLPEGGEVTVLYPFVFAPESF